MFTLQNIDAFLEGVGILGTCGGGSPEWGRAIMEHDLAMGRQAKIVDPMDVPDDATVISGGIMGSVKYLDKIDPHDLVKRWDEKFELAESIRVMEETIQRKVDYIVPFEMGGLNTPVILSVGARIGIPVIDGDGVGRAAPETQMCSFIGHGISLTPMPLVDAKGNVVVVRKGMENTFADMVGRFIITRGGGLGANTHFPMSGAVLKTSVIPNTVSQALSLGQAVLEARACGKDAVAVVASEVGGKFIHTGVIKTLEDQEWEGFYFTRLSMDGNIEIIIKNETMALFIDGKPATIFPDFILLLDPESGKGLMSADLREGQKISVVVKPCHERLRQALETKDGKIAFSGVRYGQPELAYRPVEQLIQM